MPKKPDRKINARRKGRDGELEVAKIFRDVFKWDGARRRNQFQGQEGSDDVYCGWDGLHIEVKRRQQYQVNDWMAQAIGDCGKNFPVVVHRRDRTPWVAIWPHQNTHKMFDLIQKNLHPDHRNSLDTRLYEMTHIYGGAMRGHVWTMVLKPLIRDGRAAMAIWSNGQFALSACLLEDLIWLPNARRDVPDDAS